MANVFEVISENIIAALDGGNIPWRKPWKGGDASWPRNASSGRRYNGVNVWLLSMNGYEDTRWLTYKQALGADGNVRKGEHGTTVIFWKISVKDTFDTVTQKWEKKGVPILRNYTVFNVEQCENLNEKKLAAKPDAQPAEEWDAIVEAEGIIASYLEGGPRLSHRINSDRAFYSPLEDSISLPGKTQFTVPGEYYSTAFHELGHSTGHKDRLNRFGENYTSHFGDEAYSKEELVAEFTSAFLCAEAGIDNTLDNSTAYINGWNKKFREDNRVIIYAAAQAQKAANFIRPPVAELADEVDEVIAA